jgi:hypothetical protein
MRTHNYMMVVPLLTGGLFVMGCESADMQTAGADGFTRVAEEAQFREAIVGREIAFGEDRGRYDQDGTWVMTREGQPLASGTWEWEDGRWCREGTSRAGPVARDCQIIELSSDGLRFTRSDGSGNVATFVN